MDTQPGSAMRRTPPGSPPAAVGLAEPEEGPSWFRRLLLRLTAEVGRVRTALR